MKIFTEPSCCFLIFVLLSTDLAASNPVNSLLKDAHEWSNINCFNDEPPTTLRVIEGESFRLTCRPLDNCLHSGVHWIKQFDDGTVESVNDSRTTVDPAGTLWFSNVTKLDASVDEFYYACAVFSPSKNEIKVGKRVILVVDSGNEWANKTCFRDQLPETMRANEGDPFKLACQVLDDCPHAGVYWLTMDYNGGIKSIDNSRMTLDPEGNLWFSNVTKLDASDYFYYACVVISPSKNEYKVGNRVILDVVSRNISGFENKREPVKQYVSRKTQIALRGKKIELFCIYGGSPLPVTVWSKNGQRIPPSHRVIEGHYGKSLVIKRASFEDNGVYACNVSNGVGTNQTYSVELAVQSAPVFTREPRMISAVEGESVEFACEAAGVPEPKIEWTYNGRLLAEDPHDRKVPGRLVLTNLKKEQAGKYGCIAANTHGYVYVDVDLNMLESVAPKILRQRMDADTVDGKIVKITCGVNGGPNTKVKWTRDGQELIGGRYEIMQSGDLQIKDVSFSDAGVYTCIATNKLGSANATSHLAVKEHTWIQQRPENHQVPTGGAATFRCGAITDSTLPVRIDWLKDGVPVDFELYPRFVLSDDGSLTIAKINALDSGTYTCIASTDLDEVRAQATLVVRAVPNPPTLLGVYCGYEEAVITWDRAGDSGSPIQRYSIQYNTSFAPDTWETAKDDIPAISRSHAIKLSPWANYTFRVIGWNEVGPSEPSSSSSVCSTLPNVPYENPKDVGFEDTDSGSLTIKWTVMPQIEHHAPKFMYRVYYKRDVPEEKWTFEDIHDWRTNRFKLNVTSTYQWYRIKIVAINERGESLKKPQEVTFFVGKHVFTQAPANFTVEKVRSNTTALPLNSKKELAGKYGCNATNLHNCIYVDLDLVMLETAISKILRPSKDGTTADGKIIDTPATLRVNEGDPFKFTCQPTGDYPHSRIYWVKQFNNGTLNLINDSRITVDLEGNLLFSNITKLDASDDFYYSCVVLTPSKHEVKIGSRMLLVVTSSNVDETTVDGKTINMTCRISGAPKLEVKWMRNGQELIGGRYKVMKTGDLQIRDVSFSDAGEYTCIASNKFGSANATSHLAVKEHTRIQDRPENHQVPTGGAATFRCSAVTDSTLPVRIDWLKNRDPIDFESDLHFALGNDGSLTIAKINALDSGTYTCIASTDLDEVRAQATLVVQDVPNPPILLGVTCSFDEATVKWAPAGDNHSPILRYSIQYNSSFAPDIWEKYNYTFGKDPAYTFKFAPRGANYTFRVVALNKIGASKPSSLSSMCSMLDEVPYKNPKDVRCEGTDPGSLTVNWTVIPKSMYRVYYKRDFPEEKWTFKNVLDSRTNHFKINVIHAYQRYKIKVVAFNERGESSEKPQEVVCVSGEDVPTQAPANFTVEKVRSSTTALLSWSKVPGETVMGELQGYKIDFWSDKGGSKEYVVEGAKKTSALIDKFVPYSKNYARIRAYNKRFRGPPSEVISFETPEGVPGPVKNLRAHPIDSRSMEVKWNKPSEINGILTGYKVTYQMIIGSYVGFEMDLYPEIRDADITKAELIDLSAETKYRVTVRATTNAGEGEPNSVEETTPPRREFTYSPSSDWSSSYFREKTTPAPRRVHVPYSSSKDWSSKSSTRRKYNPRWDRKKSYEPSWDTWESYEPSSSAMDALTAKMIVEYMTK